MKKKIKYFICTYVLLSILTINIINSTAIALESKENEYLSYSQDVKVVLNGELLNFDVQPTIINDRTLVPFRVIFEALGAKVDWDGENRVVIAEKEGVTISLKIDSKDAYVNQKKKELDVPALIIDDRTLIPARFIAEAMGCVVDWEGDSRSVVISAPFLNNEKNDKEFNFLSIAIGDSEEKVIKQLGAPNRKDMSKYGFKWYVYNNDYSRYIQVGISDNKVVGIYTNASNWKSKSGISIASNRKDVTDKFGKSLTAIKKGNTNFMIDSADSDTYLIDNYYATIFYDIHQGDKISSVLLIEKNAEENLKNFYGEASEELKEGFERQMFDLANATRAKFKKKAYKWDDLVSIIAYKHSEDMGKRDYFSHTNPEGESPFDRMKEANLDFKLAAENIAAGQPSAIFAHESLMNSKGHRDNILGECEKLGIGVYFGGSYNVYYTQNFFTPKN